MAVCTKQIASVIEQRASEVLKECVPQDAMVNAYVLKVD